MFTDEDFYLVKDWEPWEIAAWVNGKIAERVFMIVQESEDERESVEE